ncbi:MAG: HAD hydrolase-like protein [Candidatus Bipolaricaulota bacterium]|nr:MAG: HAD hydrolase-like protein [Candidatus Bipolaricaulota bacterium]
MPTPAEQLDAFSAIHGYLVCIDSDGCAFDTMGIKQRECFCPWMIEAFGLQPVAAAARECKEFADLFSRTRGANRHITIKRILTELLPSHPLVKARGFEVPQLAHYFAWVNDPRSLLSNEGLKKSIAAAATAEERTELAHVLTWSERVNWSVEEIVKGIPPFPGVRAVLQQLTGRADVVVVSATPLEALLREWEEHEITSYAGLICGQEMGTKAEHIAAVSRDLPRDRVLMVGDAPGDLEASKANGVLFFPIVPGEEEVYWRTLLDEGLARFFDGSYCGSYEQSLLDAFDRALPESPPWEEKT